MAEGGHKMSCKITPRQVGDVTILDCEGRITLGEGSVTFREAIQICVYGKALDYNELTRPKRQLARVLLHLGNVHYMDSSGLGELIYGYAEVSNAGGSLKLLCLREKILNMLLITKLDSIFQIFDDEEKAVRSFH
jgi:anti-sigma B factor antagonist